MATEGEGVKETKKRGTGEFDGLPPIGEETRRRSRRTLDTDRDQAEEQMVVRREERSTRCRKGAKTQAPSSGLRGRNE